MEGPAASTHAILITGFLFSLLLLSPELNGCHGARLINPGATATVEFIKTSCGATTYPQLCYSSLSAYAGKIQTSPLQLANTALSLALGSAQSASAQVSKASLAGGGMKPRDAAAVRDCMELMGDSVDELRQSLAMMGHLGGQNLRMQISDMQTWVSAALTDDETCVEGLQGGAGAAAGNTGVGEVKNMVRGQVLNVAQMTSNALALINGLVSVRSSSP